MYSTKLKTLIDEEIATPCMCEECKHFIKGCQCAAFDKIPLEFFHNANKHDTVIIGQKGKYTFLPDKKIPTMRVYKVID